MAPRIPLFRASLLRPLLLNQTHYIPNKTHQALAPLQNPCLISNPNPSFPLPKPSPFGHLRPFFTSSRTFSSGPSSSKMVSIGSEEEFNTALNKVQDGEMPAIFYYTAVWCGPCKVFSPVLEEVSTSFPHVAIYKIDIDQEGLARTLENQKIFSVPTLHFFQDGKKAAEMVGADVPKLRGHMDTLYKNE